MSYEKALSDASTSASTSRDGTPTQTPSVPAALPATAAAQGPPKPKIPYTSQFWDDAITRPRKIYISILFQRTCLLIAAIFGIFSIYWGALKQVPARSLKGWIIDFDGDSVGQFVTQELSLRSGRNVYWNIVPASNFPGGTEDLIHALVEEHAWVAVAINAGATKSMNESLAGRNPSYNSSDAITAYASEARNENSFRTLLRPTVTNNLDEITHDYAVQFIKNIFESNVTITSISPDLLTRPVYFTLQNIRPFDIPVATAVTFIGLIYLLILSFVVTNAGILARAGSGLDKSLTTMSLIRVRLGGPVIIYFFLSLAYTLLSLAFGLNYDRHFGRAGFLIFWFLSYFGMMAAGLALEAMITLLTVKFIQVFLILWIIGNVSVCLWPIDALPVVYKYGHVAPFYQLSRGVRAIVFGTKNELGLNFGILAVWILISCITLPLIQGYRRKQEVDAWKASQRKAGTV